MQQQSHSQPPTSDEWPLIAEQLEQAVDRLRKSDREAILLRFYRRQSFAEVGQTLGITEEAARKRVSRATEKLRGMLHTAGVSVPATALATILLVNVAAPASQALAGSVIATAVSGAGISKGALILMASLKAKSSVAIAIALLFLAIGGATIAIYSGSSSGPAPTPAGTPIQAIRADAPGTTAITGSVQDAAGRPIAGVLVSQGENPDVSEGYHTTRTDASGRFSLPRVKLATGLAIAAQSPGYAPELRQGIVTAGMEPFTFSLKPGSVLRVRIVDARGNPIPGLPLDPMDWQRTQVLRIFSMRGGWNGPMTDANGVATWNSAPADEVTFDFVTPDHLLRRRLTLTASPELQTITMPDAIPVRIEARDAETNSPLPAFTVAYGRGSNSTSAEYWDGTRSEQGTDGVYETILRWSFPYHFFRVEAPGYEPRVLRADESNPNIELQFDLPKQTTSLVTVLSPDGQPAAGAEVYVIGSKQNFSLQASKLFLNGRFSFGGGNAVQQTDEHGKVSIVDPQDTAARVVVLHEQGFIELPLQDAMKSPVQLRAWAMVQGTARIGAAPASGKEVSVSYSADHGGQPYISGTFAVTTDANGRFSLPRVPAGQLYAGIWVEANTGSRFASGTIGHPVSITTEPGKIASVSIGGRGSPVIGRIVGADGNSIPAAVYRLASLETDSGLPPRPSKALEERFQVVRKLPQAEAIAASKLIMEEPEYKAFMAAQTAWNRSRKRISFAISPDGGFRVDDVESGDYTLAVSIIDGNTSEVIGSISTPVVVPPIQDERSDTPVDLGKISPKPKPAGPATRCERTATAQPHMG